MAYPYQYIPRESVLRPLVVDEEVTIVVDGRRQHAWVLSWVVGGVYTLRTSSGAVVRRLRQEIEA